MCVHADVILTLCVRARLDCIHSICVISVLFTRCVCMLGWELLIQDICHHTVPVYTSSPYLCTLHYQIQSNVTNFEKHVISWYIRWPVHTHSYEITVHIYDVHVILIPMYKFVNYMASVHWNKHMSLSCPCRYSCKGLENKLC